LRRVAAILALSVMVTGCWTRREITETAFVGMMAVDWVNDQYAVTASVLMPKTASTGNSGGKASDATGSPIWTVRAEAASLDQAVGLIDRISPRRVNLAHVRAVILGEALARRGIWPVLDYLSRAVELRPNLWVGVTPGLAEELLTARPILEPYPGNGPLGYHDLVPLRGGLAPARKLVHVIRTLTEEGIDLVLPAFRVAQQDQHRTEVNSVGQDSREILVGGIAAFQGDRLVAWLEPEDSRGVVFALGEGSLGPLTVPCGHGPGVANLRMRGNKSRAIVYRNGQRLTAQLSVTITADVNEAMCQRGPGDIEQLAALELELAKVVKQSIENAFRISQENATDVLGIGMQLFHRSPTDYRMLAPDWPRALRETQLQVRVQARIPRTGQVYDSVERLGEQKRR